MSWEYVFNTNLLIDLNTSFYSGNSLDKCREFIKKTGYKFFTFNGLVYDLRGERIGIKIEDLF